jgi:hypothetical protein
LHFQGLGRKPLVGNWIPRAKRALVVAPFIQPDFVATMLTRSEELHIVSIPETLDALPDETIGILDARASEQGSPVLYQVTGHGNPDDAYIDGLHAKLLLLEDSHERSATYIGSSNATGPGWGLSDVVNVEAVLEMRPGIGIDRFIHGFIRPSKTKTHPWVTEYDQSARVPPDEERRWERRLLAALREVSALQFVEHYDPKSQRLDVSIDSSRTKLPPWVYEGGVNYFFAPFLLAEAPEYWHPLEEVQRDAVSFDGLSIDKITAFVSIRANCELPKVQRQRVVIAKLHLDKRALEERDSRIRADIIATTDPAMVLKALIHGVAHVRSETTIGNGKGGKKGDLRTLLAETTLERLLQAIALDHELVKEMRLLLGPLQGEPLLKLCDDLDEVMQRVENEVNA